MLRLLICKILWRKQDYKLPQPEVRAQTTAPEVQEKTTSQRLKPSCIQGRDSLFTPGQSSFHLFLFFLCVEGGGYFCLLKQKRGLGHKIFVLWTTFWRLWKATFFSRLGFFHAGCGRYFSLSFFLLMEQKTDSEKAWALENNLFLQHFCAICLHGAISWVFQRKGRFLGARAQSCLTRVNNQNNFLTRKKRRVTIW